MHPNVGTRVTGDVVAHHRWGIDVRLLAPYDGVMGVVDSIYTTGRRPFRGVPDYPPIGARLDLVVLATTPSGQLRLSAHPGHLSLRWPTPPTR